MFCLLPVETLVKACTGISFQGFVECCCQTVICLRVFLKNPKDGRVLSALNTDFETRSMSRFLSWMVQRKLQILLRLLCHFVDEVQTPGRFQHRIWEKGCLSSSSALGLCLASTKMQLMKSRAWSEVCEGSSGLVGWVAILNIAAMASYSAHGGFSVSISTTVQPRLL